MHDEPMKTQNIGTTAGVFTTGDIKLTIKTIEKGWLLMDEGTIGDAQSGATTRANPDAHDLFYMLWSCVSDAYAPVSGGRGDNAEDDWNAHKTIRLIPQLGRAFIAAGQGANLTNRALGETGGEEVHTLITGEMPAHSHSASTSGSVTIHAYNQDDDPGRTPDSSRILGHSGADLYSTHSANTTLRSDQATLSASTSISSSGSNAAHNNMQPYTAWNVLIKL